MVVTPASIENRLVQLSKEVDESHDYLDKAERQYLHAKTEHELAIAKTRLGLSGEKMRVQDVQDYALVKCADSFTALNIAEGVVKAARANATRIRTQVDIARSIGTSVRASLEI
jgi:hypothetical protein